MPRLLKAEFRIVLADDGAPQLAVLHASGRTVAYDKRAMAGLLSPLQMAGLCEAIVAAHADADAKVREGIAAELASMERDE